MERGLNLASCTAGDPWPPSEGDHEAPLRPTFAPAVESQNESTCCGSIQPRTWLKKKKKKKDKQTWTWETPWHWWVRRSSNRDGDLVQCEHFGCLGVARCQIGRREGAATSHSSYCYNNHRAVCRSVGLYVTRCHSGSDARLPTVLLRPRITASPPALTLTGSRPGSSSGRRKRRQKKRSRRRRRRRRRESLCVSPSTVCLNSGEAQCRDPLRQTD